MQQYVLDDGVFQSAGEHAERITIACTSGQAASPVRIDLTAVW